MTSGVIGDLNALSPRTGAFRGIQAAHERNVTAGGRAGSLEDRRSLLRFLKLEKFFTVLSAVLQDGGHMSVIRQTSGGGGCYSPGYDRV